VEWGSLCGVRGKKVDRGVGNKNRGCRRSNSESWGGGNNTQGKWGCCGTLGEVHSVLSVKFSEGGGLSCLGLGVVGSLKGKKGGPRNPWVGVVLVFVGV